MSSFEADAMEFKSINFNIPTIKLKSYKDLLTGFVHFKYKENTIITDDELANKSLEEILYGDTISRDINIEEQLCIAA